MSEERKPPSPGRPAETGGELAERHRNALERIEAMAVRPRCACGRPTGTAAIRACAHAALRGEDDHD